MTTPLTNGSNCPIAGQDGTFDMGDTKEDRIRRYKVLNHALVHYHLPADGLSQCPYCGGLVLRNGDHDA